MRANFLKALTLHLLAILLVMFNFSVSGSSAVLNFMPLFDVMIIYYFAVYQEKVFSIWFLFLLGLWSDSLTGVVPGVTSLVYIISVQLFVILSNRMAAKEDFKDILYNFSLFLIFIVIFKWLILSIYHMAFYNIIPVLSHLIISIPCYVVMHQFFDYLGGKLIEDKDASGF